MWIDIIGRACNADCIGVDAKRFFVITCSFGRAVDDRRALFEDVLVGESFEDDLVSDAVDVALSYTDFAGGRYYRNLCHPRPVRGYGPV